MPMMMIAMTMAVTTMTMMETTLILFVPTAMATKSMSTSQSKSRSQSKSKSGGLCVRQHHAGQLELESGCRAVSANAGAHALALGDAVDLLDLVAWPRRSRPKQKHIKTTLDHIDAHNELSNTSMPTTNSQTHRCPQRTPKQVDAHNEAAPQQVLLAEVVSSAGLACTLQEPELRSELDPPNPAAVGSRCRDNPHHRGSSLLGKHCTQGAWR